MTPVNPARLTDVAAVVLAAGASRRLGRPKGLLMLEGRPAVELVARRIAATGVTCGVVVIGGADADALRAGADPSPLVWVENPDPQAGRLGSLRVGLGAIPPACDVLLWPIDRPMADEAVVRALLAARGGRGERFTVSPVAEERGGHPIVLGAALRERILGAPPDANLRDVLAAADVRRIDVRVDAAAGIHVNLDTEEAYRRERKDPHGPA